MNIFYVNLSNTDRYICFSKLSAFHKKILMGTSNSKVNLIYIQLYLIKEIILDLF